MAKLGVYYALCPLIDAKSILGVTEDVEKGFVIVTLDKNIAGKYKLSDQKQVVCWRTKEKFSSPVLYDRSLSKYVAVFNQSYIKAWDIDENLDKVKKYKFVKKIHTLFSNGEDTFIVFQKGSVHKVQGVLSECKSLIPEDMIKEEIVDVFHKSIKDLLYIGLMTKTEENYELHWSIYKDKHIKFSVIKLSKENLTLRGWTFHLFHDSMVLISCWSDKSIFLTVLDNTEEKTSAGELFTVIESVSMQHPISVVSLDENYIALYGGNSNEEGAILLLYNTQFKVVQRKQPFKLFNQNAKIWLCNCNLMFPVGQNLAVIPFYLEKEQLAALVGSHNNFGADIKLFIEVDFLTWENKHQAQQKVVPEILQERVQEYLKQGLPEALVLEELLPNIFQTNDVQGLHACIRFFSDIPEKYLVKILKYLIDLDNDNFKSEKCDIENIPSNLQPLERIDMIDQILSMSFTETFLLPYLRAVLSLKDVLLVLEYICAIWEDDEHLLPKLNPVKTHAKLIAWSCILIDSNYQKLVLSKNKAVINVFLKMMDLIEQSLNCLTDLQMLQPMLSTLNHGKHLQKDWSLNLKYSVEQLSLY